MLANKMQMQSRVGVAGSRLPARTMRAMPVRPARGQVQVRASSQQFDRNWLRVDPLVPIVSFLGWTIPSNIGVSAFGGNSLFGAFYERVGANLANWPTGPSLDDPFWLYMVSWHIGLFVTMLLGQVGVQGRKQGYW